MADGGSFRISLWIVMFTRPIGLSFSDHLGPWDENSGPLKRPTGFTIKAPHTNVLFFMLKTYNVRPPFDS